MCCCKDDGGSNCGGNGCCSSKEISTPSIMDYLEDLFTCPVHPGTEYKGARLEEGNVLILSYPCECTFRFEIKIIEE